MLISQQFCRYEPELRSLPANTPLAKSDLLTEEFLWQREGRLEIFFAPHNEYLNPDAKVAIIGITPGWGQMESAFRAARKALEEGRSAEEVCRQAKRAARFSGSMRRNLLGMLDELGLHDRFKLSSCEEMFEAREDLLHSTSVLRFPVFVDRLNYNGHSPALTATPLLKDFAVHSVRNELAYLKAPLIIPLGKTVESVLRLVASEGMLEPARCLWGFPHPSGANGHRHRQFAEAASRMKETIRQFEWEA